MKPVSEFEKLRLSFPDGDAENFVRYFQEKRLVDHRLDGFEITKPKIGRGKFASTDTTTVVVSIITSAKVAALANGLISIIRDYLTHTFSNRELKTKSELARTRISVSIGDKKIEVEQSSSETIWREILDALQETVSRPVAPDVSKLPTSEDHNEK